uniref:RNA-directed DNA polymerase n=1 Tax=Trichogramma kaykai TaxID=54128 RepID=A0ABD2XB60_9HYME
MQERRLYVTDRRNNIRFLVDSGSVLSIIPKRIFRRPFVKRALVLQAANATLIATFGERKLTLNLGLRRPLEWTFIIADVSTAILGADLIIRHDLLIDLPRRRLLDRLTNVATSCSVGPLPEVYAVSPVTAGVGEAPVKSLYQRMAEEFASTEVLAGEMACIPDLPVQHHIVTVGQPVFTRPRRLAGERLEAAKSEFANLLERKIIRPSSSQWASPLHLVPKPGGSWRVTGDYRLLNTRTRPDRHPLPIIEDLLQEISGDVFSVVDLYRAFYQIPVAPEDIPKTAVTTPFGLFEFVGMPLGLRNSAQTFQRAMNHLLRDLPFVRCYQDDILVLSTGHDEHARHLRELFTVLCNAKLHVNWTKCQLGQEEVIFAGYHVSSSGFRPPESKTQAIVDFPRPVDSTQLRRFLGMTNFYRRCIPGAAALMAPLTELLKGLVKKKERLAWTPEAEAAFERTKKAMTEAVRSSFLSPSQPLALYTDASDTAIGAALNQQRESGVWVPLGFFSRKLSPTEQRYSTYDRELLAIYASIKHFQRILEGRSFRILTDHKPLSYALEQRTDKHSPRQARQLDFIAQFDTVIQHTPGEDNAVADALSRVDSIAMPTVVTTKELSEEQKNDPQLPHVRNNKKIKTHRITLDDNELIVVERDGVLRPYIPVALRRAIFDSVHRLSHPSGRATAKRIELSYFWPSLRKDVGRWAKQCMPCQLSKVHRHNCSELGNFNTPDSRFEHIHLDLIKMPLSLGCQNCLTIIDRYTRWPEAIPLPDISAQSVAEALYKHWIAFFGAPLTITTDQGAQFESKLLKQLGGMIGAKHIHTSPYHPQGNAMVERLHRTLKAAFKCSPETPWTSALPTVLLGLRTAFKEDLQASPAEMVFGTALRIPGELVIKQDATPPKAAEFVVALRRLFASIRPVQASRHTQHKPFVFKDLSTCEYVMRRLDTIKKPLDPPYSGPHRVVRRVNDRTYIVDVNGSEKAFSTDQLKPAYYETSDEASRPGEREPAPSAPQRSSPEPSPPADPTPTAQLASPTQPRPSRKTSPAPTGPRTRRVSFTLPSQNARSTGRGVAVAPSSQQNERRRSRRCLGLSPSSDDR